MYMHACADRLGGGLSKFLWLTLGSHKIEFPPTMPVLSTLVTRVANYYKTIAYIIMHDISMFF